MSFDVAGRIGKLCEDQDLLLGGAASDLTRRMSFWSLSSCLRLELPRFVQEPRDLIEVKERLRQHLLDVVLVRAFETLDGVEHLLGNDVFVVRVVFSPHPKAQAGVGQT